MSRAAALATRTLLGATLLAALLVPFHVDAVSTARQEATEAAHSRPNLDRGAELFRVCAGCHGQSGAGTPDGQIPRIGSQHASVLQKQLVDYRHDHRWDPRMELVAGPQHLINAEAIADVTAYVSQLRPLESSGHGRGDMLIHGAESYFSACRGCHGGAAEGDSKRVIPKLAGQHYEYLRRQIYDAVDGRRPNLSPTHIRMLARLDHADIEAVADYLSRLGDQRARRADD